ncbi:MAG TPA: sulfotransferase [Opitutales bacterium]|nr:sulfotransferase [Opitutales bacterium]
MHLFFQSLVRHFSWWAASLWPGRHEGAPLGGRRLLFLLLFYPAFLAFQCLHWLGFGCDELFFPSYRKVSVEAPVFILGVPRSGTTFLHRTLAEDRKRFTSFSTWEAMLAPSISERKLVGLLKAIDRTIGAPVYKLIQSRLRSASADFERIHQVGLSAAEEDYLSLLPAGGCFILLLAFPFSPQLRQLGRLDEMPKAQRQRLLDFYKRALQRHLYDHPGKRLLSKNAAFATWAGALHAIFPDAKFLLCIREPGSALSSQLSSLAPARAFFGSDPDGSHTADSFTELYGHFYARLEDFLANTSPGQAALIEQSDLKAAPAATITAALEQLGIEKSRDIDHTLAALTPGQASAHRHGLDTFSLDPGEIQDRMSPPYEAMLRSPNRIRNPE